MSMNIYITASRKITFKKKNGKRGGGIQTEKFDAVQTPTAVTHAILAGSDLKQAYIDYVKTLSRVDTYPVYADDDYLGEGDPVGFYEHDWTQEHIEKFTQWVNDMEDNGYSINFEQI